MNKKHFKSLLFVLFLSFFFALVGCVGTKEPATKTNKPTTTTTNAPTSSKVESSSKKGTTENKTTAHTHKAEEAWISTPEVHYHECESCDEHLNEEAHTFTEWTKVSDPTYDTKGSEKRTCTVCNYEETKDIDKLVHVESVSLDKETLEIGVNGNAKLVATVSPENAFNKKVTWTIEDDTIVAVRDGNVVGLKNGSTTITVTTEDGSFTDTCNVVVSTLATSLEVSANGLLFVGETSQIETTILPAETSDKSITYSSSNAQVATVSSTGLITAVSAGKATITAKTSNNIEKTIEVIVFEGTTTTPFNTIGTNNVNSTLNVYFGTDGIRLDITFIEANANDKSHIEGLIFFDGNVTKTTAKHIRLYPTTNTFKAYDYTGPDNEETTDYRFNENQNIERLMYTVAVEGGYKMTVYIPYSAFAGATDLTKANVNFLIFNNAGTRYHALTTTLNNATLKLRSNSVQFDKQGYVYTSFSGVEDINLDETTISGTNREKTFSLSIDKNNPLTGATLELPEALTGKVILTETAPGTYKITVAEADKALFATAQEITIKAPRTGLQDTFTVVVSDKIEVASVTLNKTSGFLLVNETVTLTATVSPDNADEKTVTWTTSDETIATVVDGVVTALKEGSATITATCGGKTATYTLYVCPAEGASTPATIVTNNGVTYTTKVTFGDAVLRFDSLFLETGMGDKSHSEIMIYFDGNVTKTTAKHIRLYPTTNTFKIYDYTGPDNEENTEWRFNENTAIHRFISSVAVEGGYKMTAYIPYSAFAGATDLTKVNITTVLSNKDGKGRLGNNTIDNSTLKKRANSIQFISTGFVYDAIQKIDDVNLNDATVNGTNLEYIFEVFYKNNILISGLTFEIPTEVQDKVTITDIGNGKYKLVVAEADKALFDTAKKITAKKVVGETTLTSSFSVTSFITEGTTATYDVTANNGVTYSARVTLGDNGVRLDIIYKEAIINDNSHFELMVYFDGNITKTTAKQLRLYPSYNGLKFYDYTGPDNEETTDWRFSENKNLEGYISREVVEGGYKMTVYVPYSVFAGATDFTQVNIIFVSSSNNKTNRLDVSGTISNVTLKTRANSKLFTKTEGFVAE